MSSETEETAQPIIHRSPAEGYLEESLENLKEIKNESAGHNDCRVLVFRLGKEWVALKTEVVLNIVSAAVIHQIPHQNRGLIRGIVNIRGVLRYCVDLAELLEMENGPQKEAHKSQDGLKRMIHIFKEEDHWIIEADEVKGICSFNYDELENIPITVAKSTANYFQGLVFSHGLHFGVLEDELLFFSLRRKAL